MSCAHILMRMSPVNPKQLQSVIKAFPALRIGVIGDIMLDRFEYGHIERMSPEAPVPVVRMESKTSMPGGAGNVAVNCAALGGQVDLCGVIGNDEAGRELCQLLEQDGIRISGIYAAEDRATTQKKRIVVAQGHVMRVDYESRNSIPKEVEKKLNEYVAEAMPSWNAIIIADYAKGVMTQELADSIQRRAQTLGIPVIVDTKPENAGFYSAPALVTPNHKEAVEISGASDLKTGGSILEHYFSSPVLVTCGEDGMMLFANGDVYTNESHAKEVVDVSGAGDTVIAASTLSLAAGASWEEMIHIASLAAGIVVGKKGTAVATRDELISSLYDYEQ